MVLQEKTAAPTGRHVEVLGSHDPHQKVTVLKEDRIKYWLEKGAQASDTVYNLLVAKGIITGKKRVVKVPAKKVEEVAAEVPATEAKPEGEVKTEEPAKTEDTAAAEAPKEKVEVEEAPKEEVKEENKPEETKAEEAPKEEVVKEEAKIEEKKEPAAA